MNWMHAIKYKQGIYDTIHAARYDNGEDNSIIYADSC